MLPCCHAAFVISDPRWGRGQETPGESPTLTASYATNFVQGLQEGESWPSYIKASACLKHFAVFVRVRTMYNSLRRKQTIASLLYWSVCVRA